MVYRFVSNRSTLIGNDEQNVKDLIAFLDPLRSHLNRINAFYSAHNLDHQYKVNSIWCTQYKLHPPHTTTATITLLDIEDALLLTHSVDVDTAILLSDQRFQPELFGTSFGQHTNDQKSNKHLYNYENHSRCLYYQRSGSRCGVFGEYQIALDGQSDERR